VENAMKAGVFGSPHFLVDGEPFWGVDRIPMLEEWLRSGGW
jgi:2-hydroxychromene-2-carboxylate isomerase